MLLMSALRPTPKTTRTTPKREMKILIVYYSLYGHVFKLAQAVKEGAESVKGAEVLFRRVEEFDVVLKKTADDKYLSQVREQQKDIPVCTLDDLRAADGVLIGSPTRYGNMTAQMKETRKKRGLSQLRIGCLLRPWLPRRQRRAPFLVQNMVSTWRRRQAPR